MHEAAHTRTAGGTSGPRFRVQRQRRGAVHALRDRLRLVQGPHGSRGPSSPVVTAGASSPACLPLSHSPLSSPIQGARKASPDPGPCERKALFTCHHASPSVSGWCPGRSLPAPSSEAVACGAVSRRSLTGQLCYDRKLLSCREHPQVPETQNESESYK